MVYILMHIGLLFIEFEISHCQTFSNGSRNVALHKTTRQSSMFQNYVSDLAVDGDIRQILYQYNTDYCTHTDLYDDVFWWTVDLENTFWITSVVVYGRTDACVERLSHFEVVLYNPKESLASWDDFTKSNGIVMYKHDIVTLPAIIHINCSNVCIGRYVRIQIDNRNAVPAHYDGKKALTLCEVEVYGNIYDSTTRDMCQCPCKDKQTDLNQQVGDAMNKISDLVKSLKVDKTMLSTTKRSKISSYDGRASSQYIGICGSAILIFIPCLIICSDLFTFLNKLK